MEREQYKNRLNLGLSQEEVSDEKRGFVYQLLSYRCSNKILFIFLFRQIAKIEGKRHRILEAKRKHATRTSKEVWSRLRQGIATKSDMKIVERSRKSNQIWRVQHPEAEANRKKKVVGCQKEGWQGRKINTP